MKSLNKLFYTTIALTLTSFLMKTVAVWFNVYLTAMIGTVGIGIFQLILSVYAMAKTLGYGGMNLAATRLCIDDFEHRRHSMRRLLPITFLIGSFAMAILFMFAKPISIHWILKPEATQSLKILSISLPFVALSSALNGYMTAARKMGRYSIIQFLEQCAKILFTLIITEHIDHTNVENTIAGVCCAISLSEVFSFSLAIISYVFDIRKYHMKKEGKAKFIRRMTRLALPDALGSYIRSGLNTVEHLLIPKGIRNSGASTEKALSDYGTVQGMALPILLYPSSILGVLSGLLVPEIAECKIKNRPIQTNYIINRVLHMAMIFAMFTSSAMLLFSEEISLAVYHNTSASYYIRLLGPLIPIMYLDMTTDGMLKGLDLQLNIMKINLIDSFLCVILVWILVPRWAVDGYIVTIYVAEIINFLMSFYQLGKNAKVRFAIGKNFLIPLLSAFIGCLVGRLFLECTKIQTLNLIVAISVGIGIYYLLLRILKGISKEDSRWMRKMILPN